MWWVCVYLIGHSDYDGADQYVRLAGATIISFAIQLYNDDSIEGYETFDIYIVPSSLPHNIYIGSQSRATVSIVDDDCECFIGYVFV